MKPEMISASSFRLFLNRFSIYSIPAGSMENAPEISTFRNPIDFNSDLISAKSSSCQSAKRLFSFLYVLGNLRAADFEDPDLMFDR